MTEHETTAHGAAVGNSRPLAWLYTIKSDQPPCNPILSRFRWHEDHLARSSFDEMALVAAPTNGPVAMRRGAWA